LACHIKGKYKFRVFGNGVLRIIFGPNERTWWESGEDWIMRNFVTCTVHQRLDSYNQNKECEMGGSHILHWRGEECIWPENRKGRRHLGDLGVEGRIILKLFLKK
jgi:hypothetical protein